MNREEFKQWTQQMNVEFHSNLDSKSGRYYIYTDSKKLTFITDIKASRVGTAKCHKDDSFDYTVGAAIAWAKLNNYEIPEIDEEPKRWRAKYDETYYHIAFRPFGSFYIEDCTECNDMFDDNRFKDNNYFKSQNRAGEVLEKVKFLLKLEQLHDIYCPDHMPNWDNSEEKKYYVYRDSIGFRTECIYRCKSVETTYFPTREIAEKVCKVLNEEMKKNV